MNPTSWEVLAGNRSNGATPYIKLQAMSKTTVLLRKPRGGKAHDILGNGCAPPQGTLCQICLIYSISMKV